MQPQKLTTIGSNQEIVIKNVQGFEASSLKALF